jgi:hypothetical protein
MQLYTFINNLLNVLVQIANKMGLQIHLKHYPHPQNTILQLPVAFCTSGCWYALSVQLLLWLLFLVTYIC